MNEKKIVLVAFLFLAVLFLSTIGSYWTGYAVLNQQDLSLKNYPYPFIKNNGYNGLYIVIPEQSTLDEQQAASTIAKGLQSTAQLPPTVTTPSNLPEGNHNLILIGDPCTNSLIGSTLQTTDCTLNLKEGQGYLKLINYDRTSTLIVSGYDETSIKKAANTLFNHNMYPIKGTEVLVSGNVNNPYSYSFLFN